MATVNICSKTAGTVYLRNLLLPNQPFISIGNSTFDVNQSTTDSSVPDYESSSGGVACSDSQIEEITLDITTTNFNAANYALATQGSIYTTLLTPIANEAVRVFSGQLSFTNQLINTAVAPLVTGTAGAPVYVNLVDYVVTTNGITPVIGGAIDIAIAAGSGTPKSIILEVDYTPVARDLIEGLTAGGNSYEVKVSTINRVNGNKVAVWTFFQVSFSAASTLTLISREFGELALVGKLTRDSTKLGTQSGYYNIQAQL